MTQRSHHAPTRGAHAAAAPPRPAERIEAMLAGVRASGLKATPQRLAIVRELAADPTHPTAQELFERLRPELPSMSFATVYNTLAALTAAGLCGALSLAPGAARFDPNMGEHHHAVCDRCGLVRDVARDDRAANASGTSVDVGDRAAARAPGEGAPPGFEVRVVERIYRGLCEGCARATRDGHRPPRPRSSARRKASA